MPPGGWKLQVGELAPIEFKAVILHVKEETEEEKLNITSDRVAELIVSGYGNKDLIIFGDQLSAYNIDPETGAVLENQ